MRNLSYHVHKEVPGADRYQEAEPGPPSSTVGSQHRRRDDAGCFGGKKTKGVWVGLGYHFRTILPTPQAEALHTHVIHGQLPMGKWGSREPGRVSSLGVTHPTGPAFSPLHYGDPSGG